MKRYVSLVVFAVLLATGCGKFEVYERNLHYMKGQTYQDEKALVAEQLNRAQANLAKAEASGDPERIKEAREVLKDATAKSRAVEAEERRRSRTW